MHSWLSIESHCICRKVKVTKLRMHKEEKAAYYHAKEVAVKQIQASLLVYKLAG